MSGFLPRKAGSFRVHQVNCVSVCHGKVLGFAVQLSFILLHLPLDRGSEGDILIIDDSQSIDPLGRTLYRSLGEPGCKQLHVATRSPELDENKVPFSVAGVKSSKAEGALPAGPAHRRSEES